MGEGVFAAELKGHFTDKEMPSRHLNTHLHTAYERLKVHFLCNSSTVIINMGMFKENLSEGIRKEALLLDF